MNHLNISSDRRAKVLLHSLRSTEKELAQKVNEKVIEMVKLQQELEARKEELNEIRIMISTVAESHQIIPDKYEQYNSDSTWKDKVLFVLEVEQRPMSTREMLDELKKVDKELRILEDSGSRQPIKSISAAVSVLKDERKIKRVHPLKLHDSFAALSEWFRDEGGLEDEFRDRLKKSLEWDSRFEETFRYRVEE
jgi:hypothetical protein